MNYSSDSIKKKQRELSSHSKKMTTKIFVYIFKIFMVILVFGTIGIVSMGAGAVSGIIETAPEITLNDVTPSQYKTTVYDCNGVQLETLVASGANRIYVTIDEIPLNLQNAFVAIEDERFYEHNGIDAKGIFRAAYVGIIHNFRFTEGASTITQQLIKNSVFSVENEDSNGDRIKRKIQEQYLALNLEEEVQDKKVILENYLNTINLGNNNLGVQSAAHNYFNKDVSELTLSECAVIAAITQSPYYYNPIRHPDNNAKRRLKVLNNMLEQKYITQAEYDEAINDDVYSRILNINSSSSTSSAYSYFTDALIQEIMEDLMTQKGYTYTQAYNLVYRGGLSIYSCEDSELQDYAETIINNPATWGNYVEYTVTCRFQIRDADGNISSYTESGLLQYLQKKYGSGKELIFSSTEEADGYIEEYKNYTIEETGGTIVSGSESCTYTLQPQTSLVVIENNTGYVRCLIGGRGNKTQSLVLNRATSSERQAGSTIKPLVVYAPALDTCGYTLGTVIDDVPYSYSTGQVIKNNDDEYKGYVSLRQSLAESRNVPAVKTLENTGISTGVAYLKNFGITTLRDADMYLPIALGTCSVTNYEMTTAYTTFANGGQYIEPKLYTKVLDHNGNVVLDNTETEAKQIIKESTAWLISNAMHSVLTSGTLSGMSFPNNVYVCAKSGTTQNNYDKWTIGFTGNYTAGIWTGYDSNREYDMKYGYAYLEIWKAVLLKANEGVDCSEPAAPSNIVKVEICKDSGLLAVDGLCDCDPRGSRVTTEYFEAGTEPTTACNIHMKVTECKDSGMIANDYCPASSKKSVIRIYKDLTGIDLEEYSVTDSKYAVTDEILSHKCTKHSGLTPPSVETENTGKEDTDTQKYKYD